MLVRLLGTIVLLAPFVALVWADFNLNFGVPCLWLFPLALAAALLGAAELHSLLSTQSHLLPSRRTCVLAVGLVLCGAAVPVYWPLAARQSLPNGLELGRPAWPLMGFLLALGLAIGGEMRRYKEPLGSAVTKAALVTFVAAYLGLLTSFLVLLRIFHSDAWGMAALVTTVTIVKLSDMGAYIVGRSFGRRRLAPLLSPNKTVAGAVGAVVFSLLAAALCRWGLVPLIVPAGSLPAAGPWWGWMLLGVLLCLAGMAGDLAESLMKRDVGQKDSSHWIPGLGGALDLLDSLLSAAPVAYAAWALGLVGPA